VSKKYLGSLEDAEDSVQEAFLKIITYHSLDSIKSVDGWVKRVVVNTAIDNYRRKKAKPLIYNSDIVELHDFSDEDEEVYINNIPNKLVLEAIESLSDAYKRVATLYLIDGFKHCEISNLLNISLGTSKSNLSKAKKNVIKYLHKYIKP
tara:strand:- start:8649 stop:9095 length:447 start_codon:yes stop_codon:yes gene_type:complete